MPRTGFFLIMISCYLFQGVFWIEYCRTSIVLCKREDKEIKAAQANDRQLNGRATGLTKKTGVSIKCDLRK